MVKTSPDKTWQVATLFGFAVDSKAFAVIWFNFQSFARGR